MKKISGTIAMILILVMLASSFTGCTLIIPLLDGFDDPDAILIGLGVDLMIGLIILGTYFLMYTVGGTETPSEAETQIYLASADYYPVTQTYLLMKKKNSLLEAGMVSVMDRLNSLPAAKLAALVSSVCVLPATEIASLTERLSALSDTELASQLRILNALSDEEFTWLSDKTNERMRFLPAIEDIAEANASKERTHIASALRY